VVHASNEKKPGDWTCSGCGGNIFRSRNQCYSCHKAKPSLTNTVKSAVQSVASFFSSATPPVAKEPKAPSKAVATEKTAAANTNDGEDGHEDGTCCICLDAKAVYTLVHGDTGHTCLCATCKDMTLRSIQRQCPVCRLPVQSVVRCFGT